MSCDWCCAYNITADVQRSIKVTFWNPYVYRAKMQSVNERKKKNPTSYSESILVKIDDMVNIRNKQHCMQILARDLVHHIIITGLIF